MTSPAKGVHTIEEVAFHDTRSRARLLDSPHRCVLELVICGDLRALDVSRATIAVDFEVQSSISELHVVLSKGVMDWRILHGIVGKIIAVGPT